MTVQLRIPSRLVQTARSDLLRPHAHAHERVGYFKVKPAACADVLLLCAFDYFPVLDEHYLVNKSVGAMIGPEGLRSAMQVAYSDQVGLFHTHLHPHEGRPWFGRYDLEQNHQFVPDMFNVAAGVPHGALIFSLDAVAGLCWQKRGERPVPITKVTEVGAPIRLWWRRR
jgi:hypothetical protein